MQWKLLLNYLNELACNIGLMMGLKQLLPFSLLLCDSSPLSRKCKIIFKKKKSIGSCVAHKIYVGTRYYLVLPCFN